MSEQSTNRWAVGIVATVVIACLGASTLSIGSRMSSIDARLSKLNGTIIENRTLILETRALIENRSCRCHLVQQNP